MRVVGGKYKRTPLLSLEGKEITRPTRDMVKEALFSIISIDNESIFLDLFAGSGAIGIEALSRGAADVIFNDSSKEAANIIRANLAKVKETRTVYELDYKDCLERIRGQAFDFIFCDPPYAFRDFDILFSLICADDLLKDKGIIILETDKRTQLEQNYASCVLYKEKYYGISRLSFYRKDDYRHD